jgi:medium-chain acyl-[acyl-carrier-protein] hydrolase
LLAFEAARRLRAHDRLPICLFASGARAPDVPRRNAPMADLPDHDFVKKLGEYQGTPREVLDNRELMELLIPLLRADFRLAEQYAYLSEPALDCPIAAIGGTADVDVTNDDLDAWRTHTGRTFTRHRVPGNHFFVSTARADVLRLVAERLAR